MVAHIDTRLGRRRVIEFDTVADMVAATFLVVGQLVRTKEYLSGTGGGNSYQIVAAATGTADGGEFINVTGPATAVQAKALGFGNDAWHQYGATGDGVADDTTEIQAAIASGKSLTQNRGTFKLIDVINITTAKQTVTLASAVRINQTTIDKGIFKTDSFDDVWIELNGATLFGEGTWSSGWTGNSGHNDRVVQFISCGFCGINGGSIKNGANAGLYIEACTRFRSNGMVIEGTDQHSTVIPASANFQNAVYVKHSSANGNCRDVSIDGFDLSGSAQGFLVEAHGSYTSTKDNIRGSGLIHDITGQHGAYLQAGGVTLDVTVRTTGLDGVKMQTPSSGADMENFNIRALVETCGSHAVEVQNADIVTDTATGSSGSATVMTDTEAAFVVNAHVGKTIVNKTDGSWQVIVSNTATTVTGLALQDGGSNTWESEETYEIVGLGLVSNVMIDLVCDAASRGLGIDNGVVGLTARVQAKDTVQQAVVVQGVNNRDIDIYLNSERSGRDGVEILAINSPGIRFHDLTVREANTTAGAFSGVKIGALANATGIEFHDPTITDSSGNQVYGIFNESDTAEFGVFGKIEITGVTTNNVRNNGLETTDFPTNATLSNGASAFTDRTSIQGKGPVEYQIQSVADTPTLVVLYQVDLAENDNAKYFIRAEVIGNFSDGTEAGFFVISGAFERTTGNCTQIGSTDTDVSITSSGTFLGVAAFAVNGSRARISVHSGATADVINWKAKVTTTRVLD